MESISQREEMLIGSEALEKLRKSRVALFGVGGVGCAVAEGLARGGIGNIDLIDRDVFSISNLNRQLCALNSTVGKSKVEVAKSRIQDIDGSICVNTFEMFFLPSTEFDFSKYDYIVDAIDTVSAKIEIAVRAYGAGVPVISCMGTGNKLDPTAFCVEDLAKTSVCPLARVMRRELKKRGILHMKVVYSKEEARKPFDIPDEGSSNIDDGKRKKATPGSISFVPPVAGFIAAGEVIRDIIGIKRQF